MRSPTAALAALALLLAPVAASAQLTHTPDADRTFAGCGIYFCASLSYLYRGTEDDTGTRRYQVTSLMTLLAPAVSGQYRALGAVQISGPLFSNNDLDDFYLGDVRPIPLGGRDAGEVLTINASYLMYVSARYIGNLDAPVFYQTRSNGLPPDELRTSIALTETPEPAPLALTVAGLGVLGVCVRRRQRA